MTDSARVVGDRTTELLDGLYRPEIIEKVAGLTSAYIGFKGENTDHVKPLPLSLTGINAVKFMSNPNVKYINKKFAHALLGELDIYDGEVIKGPLNHIIARMITIPRMLGGYIGNYPTDDEKSIYTDPRMLQLSRDELKGIYEEHYALADEMLQNPEELIRRFDMLGALGQMIAEIEFAYPAVGSTQAYELFGIFHLFPDNKEVDVTATTPGIVLPTEADPLRFKDTVEILTKNLLRPTYFEMLGKSIALGEDRVRRYSANTKGTAKNLQEYKHLLDAAKGILQGYIKLGERFQIAIGEQDPRMELATLVGDTGIVFSVRDKKQKSKIAHNVTVMDPELAKTYREIFNEQFERGELITDTAILDELMKMDLGE